MIGFRAAVQEMGPRSFPEPTIGTLRNYDGDGKENVKKAIGLMSETRTLHVHHAFCTFLCCPCTTTT